MKVIRIVTFILLSLVLTVVGVSSVALTLYRSPRFSSYWIESLKVRIDDTSMHAFNNNNIVMHLINSEIYNNGDKYVFRPPRIVITRSLTGHKVFEVFGMVTAWNPETKNITMNSYLGRPMSVRFEPTVDRSSAFVPELGRNSAVANVRNDDFIYDTESPRFEKLFCPGDILSVRVETIGALDNFSTVLFGATIHTFHSRRLTHGADSIHP